MHLAMRRRATKIAALRPASHSESGAQNWLSRWAWNFTLRIHTLCKVANKNDNGGALILSPERVCGCCQRLAIIPNWGEKNICILVLHGIRTNEAITTACSMCCEYVTCDNAKSIASPWRLFDKFKNTLRTIAPVDFENIHSQEFFKYIRDSFAAENGLTYIW